MCNHVQLHVHWMHLLNTRLCRYTCIYITPTVQTLHYCPAGAWCWNDVVQTSIWRHHVILMSCACWVRPRQVCKMLSDLENEIYRVQLSVFLTKFGHKYLLSLSAQPDYMWKNCKKIIASTHCFMHQSVFRPNYIFNNDAYFLDFCAQKFPLIFFNVHPF